MVDSSAIPSKLQDVTVNRLGAAVFQMLPVFVTTVYAEHYRILSMPHLISNAFQLSPLCETTLCPKSRCHVNENNTPDMIICVTARRTCVLMVLWKETKGKAREEERGRTERTSK